MNNFKNSPVSDAWALDNNLRRQKFSIGAIAPEVWGRWGRPFRSGSRGEAPVGCLEYEVPRS